MRNGDVPTEGAAEPPGLGRKLRGAFFLSLLTVSTASVLYLLSSYITDFVFALFFATITTPVYRRLLTKLSGRPILASSLVCTALVVAVLIPTIFLVLSISHEAATTYSAARETISFEHVDDFLFGDGFFARNIKKLSDTLGFDYSPENAKTILSRFIADVASFLYESVNTVLGNLFSALFHFAITIVVVFYLLIEGQTLKNFLFRLSPLPLAEEELILSKFMGVGRAILIGNGLGSIPQGVLGGIAMAIVGLPSPVLWGTIMAIFAFLPLVGVSIVTIPATLFLLVQGRISAAIFFFLFCTGQALLVENVLKTKLIGSYTKMNNLLIFLSILGGLQVFGVTGIFYGPLLVALFLTFAELHQQHLSKPMPGTPYGPLSE